MANILNYNQIADILNPVISEVLGNEATLLTEDLSNVVDTGRELFNSDKVDTYTKKLVNHIGKVITVDRPYTGTAPRVLMDAWKYGIVLEKINIELFEIGENESRELNDGEVYEQDIFYQPKVSVKFFDKNTTFEVPCSITEKQLETSFSSAQQLTAFVSGIFTRIEDTLVLATDSLIMRTINNFIAETIYNEYTDGNYTTKTGVRAINLLYLYNQSVTEDKRLTVNNCMLNPDFIRFASFQMGMYPDRMKGLTTLFNQGGKSRHTPNDRLHVILLSYFTSGANAYLQSDIYHDMYTKLPEADTVPFWQSPGNNYTFENISKIDVKTGDNHTVSVGGVIGCMFDEYALGVTNLDKRTTTHYNAKGEFYNYFFKQEAGYFNDFNENFVVFFVA